VTGRLRRSDNSGNEEVGEVEEVKEVGEVKEVAKVTTRSLRGSGRKTVTRVARVTVKK
jgi:hypothetical protein